MNLDFHLYGTYAAAILSGFQGDEAKKIAMAAQMVDDFTEDITNDLNTSTSTKIFDAAYIMNNLEAIIKNKLSIKPDKIKDIIEMLKTWICFHFIPGYQPFSLIEFNAKSKESLRCGTGGKVFESLVSKESNIFKGYVNLGIGMHVLADTYAHAGFSGIISRNPILQENIWIINDGIRNTLPISTIKVPINFEGILPGAFYMGHAAAGHFPDISTAVLEYQYGVDEKSAVLNKDNKEYFADAFSTLIQIMSQYPGHKSHESEYVNMWYEIVYNHLDWISKKNNSKWIGDNYVKRYSVENDNSFEMLLNDLQRICIEGEIGSIPTNILNADDLKAEYIQYFNSIKTCKGEDFIEFRDTSYIIREQIWESIRNAYGDNAVDLEALIKEDFKLY